MRDTIHLAIPLIITAGILIWGLYTGGIKRKKRLEREKRLREKGEEGELSTALLLDRVRGYKRLLHHVYVPKADGSGTSEIDLVMVHEKGIIVIENKNYRGYIYGKEDDLYWTQVYRKRYKRNFYNPVRQNQSHIRHLKRLLKGYSDHPVPYISVITFNDRGKLKRIRVDGDSALVISSRRVRRCLRRRLRRMPRVLTRSQVDGICCFLQEEAGDSRKTRKQHVKQVRRY